MVTSPANLESLVERVLATKLPPPRERRRIVARAGVSNRELAGVLDVSEMTVSRWQRGESEPRTAERAAHYREVLDTLKAAAE
jgi:DNA-binding transcriptional regulator YiaG